MTYFGYAGKVVYVKLTTGRSKKSRFIRNRPLKA